MNLIILKSEELSPDNTLKLSDRRFTHIIKVLKAKIGQSLKIGILDSSIGTGIIIAITENYVLLNCSFNLEPPPKPNFDLILALPRPKVIKRLWAPLAQLGVNRIFLTNSEKVEKNYFDTHWLKEENYNPLLINGLEQCCDTHLPKVFIINKLKPFIEDETKTLFPNSSKIIAHPYSDNSNISEKIKSPIVLALGAEGGWTDYEINMFDKAGFLKMSFGNRILKTDTACVALISIVKHIAG